MDGAHHQPPPLPELRFLHLSLVLAHAESRAEQRLARHRAKQYEQPGTDEIEFRLQPVPAGLDLGAVRALVDPALAAFGPLEVLDGVSQVDIGAVDAAVAQGPVQDPPGRPDERTSLLVL